MDEASATWTIEQAARRLGVTPALVRRWVRAGLLPAERGPDGHQNLPRAAVLGWLDGPRGPAPGRLNQRDDHLCFGCGGRTPFGLQLEFVPDGNGVRADIVPGRLREGWAGTLHGGILATLLDEALAWSLFRLQIWAVTVRLAVTYRRPAVVGAPLSVHGWLTRDRGRLVEVAGEVRAGAGAIIAEATGVFARVGGAERERLAALYGVVPPTTDGGGER